MFMITIFSYLNSEKVTIKERNFILEVLKIFQEELPRYGCFLKDIDLEKMEFSWNKSFTAESGVMGCWNPFVKNNIQIIPNLNTDYTSQYIDTIYSHILDTMPVIIHELIHKWQFQTNPILYVLNRAYTLIFNNIPYLKRFTLEYDAEVNSTSNEQVLSLFRDISSTFSARCLIEYTNHRNKNSSLNVFLIDNYTHCQSEDNRRIVDRLIKLCM